MPADDSPDVRGVGQLDSAARVQPRLQAAHGAAVCRNFADEPILARRNGFVQFQQAMLQVSQQRSLLNFSQRLADEARFVVGPLAAHRRESAVISFQ